MTDGDSLDVMESYRKTILGGAFTFRPDGSPQFRRGDRTGKKNSKTTDAVLAALYKCLAWTAAGQQGNQVYFVASDMGQANDDLELCKTLIRRNPIIEAEVVFEVQYYRTPKTVEASLKSCLLRMLKGLTEDLSLPVVDELHTPEDYRLLEALEIDQNAPRCGAMVRKAMRRSTGKLAFR